MVQVETGLARMVGSTDVKLNLTVYTIKNSVFESCCVVSIELNLILILQCDKFTGGSVAKWLQAESA